MSPSLPEPQKKGTLVCVVLKARNLPNKRSIGKQDPYCVLTLNQEALKTKPDKRGGQHPQWDEQLHFDIYEDLEELLAKEQFAAEAASTGTVNSSSSTSKSRSKPVKKTLKVTCYADDPREPEFIGEGIVDLTDTLKSGEFDEWVPLQSRDRYAGEVYLELTYYLDKAPPKKKKMPKPTVGSSTGGTGAELYGGAGVFVGDVDEDGGADTPPPPPSKHMPRPSESSLNPNNGYAGSGAGGHGNRNDRLSMTASASHGNLLLAPGLGGRDESPSGRRLSDIPTILRPSSSMANFDVYMPPYAQQALQRIPSPAPQRMPSPAPPPMPSPEQGGQHHSVSPAAVATPPRPEMAGHAPRPSISSAHQASMSAFQTYSHIPPPPPQPQLQSHYQHPPPSATNGAAVGPYGQPTPPPPTLPPLPQQQQPPYLYGSAPQQPYMPPPQPQYQHPPPPSAMNGIAGGLYGQPPPLQPQQQPQPQPYLYGSAPQQPYVPPPQSHYQHPPPPPPGINGAGPPALYGQPPPPPPPHMYSSAPPPPAPTPVPILPPHLQHQAGLPPMSGALPYAYPNAVSAPYPAVSTAAAPGPYGGYAAAAAAGGGAPPPPPVPAPPGPGQMYSVPPPPPPLPQQHSHYPSQPSFYGQ